jgi:hypothetical protein
MTKAPNPVDELVERVLDEIVRLEGERENGPFVFSYVAVEQGIRAALSTPSPDYGVLRDQVIAAFKVGAKEVHEWWTNADALERSYAERDEDPDFTEAAHDYAAAIKPPGAE